MKTKVKPDKKQPSTVVTIPVPLPHERLAAVAERYGMWARDAIRFPDLVAEAGLTPEEATSGTAHAADQHNARQLEQLVERLEATGPVVVVPPGGDVRAAAALLGRTCYAGLTALRFLRWAGSESWNRSDALAVITQLGVAEMPASTLSQELEKGSRGLGVPELDEDATSYFWELLGEAV